MRGHEFNDWVQRARAVPIEKEIERRGVKLRREGLERVGACPKCGGDDRFAINMKKQVFNCRVCGIGGDVIQLVEHLDGVDFNTACTQLTGQPPPKANGKANGKDTPKKVVVATFEYLDQNGNVAFAVDRIEFQKPDGSYVLKDDKHDKVFRQRRPDPDHPGRWIHNVSGVPVVPYRLPDLIEALANDHTIFIVEGEAKADLLSSWNVAATCCSGGSKKWKPEHSEFLRGADVVLLPDNDNAGWEHVNQVGASLSGVAARIRVLLLPDLPPKGDIIDWLAAGRTREQLDELIANAPAWQPRPEVEAEAEASEEDKAKAKADEDALIVALAKMAGIEYGRRRKKAAKELGINAGDLDREVKAYRERERDAVPLFAHWQTVIWPDLVDGDSLLRAIINRIQRFVVCTPNQALLAALWIMFSWVHETATHSPILVATSAEPESGKSTLLGVIAFLVPRSITTIEISPAALYRSIDRWNPSFIVDEFDTVLASDDKSELRAIINAGHTPQSKIIRCVEPDYMPTAFSPFCPKALGLIGLKMPAATLGRSIIIRLRRRKVSQAIEEFKHADDTQSQDLRGRLLRWSEDNAEALAKAVPIMPEGFNNRRANNYRLLFAIADGCGLDWDEKARIGAAQVEGAVDVSGVKVRLLQDIKKIFETDGQQDNQGRIAPSQRPCAHVWPSSRRVHGRPGPGAKRLVHGNYRPFLATSRYTRETCTCPMGHIIRAISGGTSRMLGQPTFHPKISLLVRGTEFDPCKRAKRCGRGTSEAFSIRAKGVFARIENSMVSPQPCGFARLHG